MIKFGLIGKSLSHSYSKIIHEKFYDFYKIDASYDLVNTTNDNLEEVVNKLRTKEYTGFNVTIPYKTEILKYVDVLSPTVLETGCCNTLMFADEKIIAYNTDIFGFEYLLNYYKIELTETLILGSGATSKSIELVLNTLNVNCKTISRNHEVFDYKYVKNHINNKIIINTTPVGMYPNTNESILSKKVAKEAKCIIDLIYNPSKTLLMSYNDNSYNGLIMLIYQAAKSFEIWTNYKVNKEIIDILIKELEVI